MLFRPSSRRMFLTGLAGSVVAIPFLPSLLPRALRSQAMAGEGDVPRRFVAVKAYNGAPVLDFYPRTAPSGYSTRGRDGTVELTDRLPVATGNHSNGQPYYGNSAPLSDFRDTGLGNIFGTAFNPYLDAMTLFRGLDFMPNLNHNDGGFLGNLGLRTSGVGGALPGAMINATIDHVMAASAAVYPTAPTGPRVLHLGTRTNTCSFAPRDPNNVLATGLDSVEQATAITDPRIAFDAIFGRYEPGEGTSSPSTLLVDRVVADYRRARESRMLSADDRQALDRHLTYLEELEQKINQGGGRVCDPGDSPGSLNTGGEFDVDVNQVEAFFDQMVDLIALAFSCDMTRIVTLDVQKMVIPDGGGRFGMGDSQNPFAAGRANWHLQAHNWDANAKRWLGLGQQWIAQHLLVRLLSRLDAVVEPDGESLLHHSMVLWGNELSFNHLNYSVPTALFGRGGGAIRAGRYMDYVDWDRPVRFSQHDGAVIEGVQYNRLLVTIMQAMGLTPEEYETEGGRGFGEYRTVEKGDGFARDYDESTVALPLPDLLNA
ncbi:MAG: DUF1552 domain-containing protein [Myxococcota bacterium]